MIIKLDNETRPEVTLLMIDFEHSSVTFRDPIDGIGTAPLQEYKTELPTVEDLKVSIEAVLDERLALLEESLNV